MKKVAVRLHPEPVYEICETVSGRMIHYGVCASWRGERVTIGRITTKREEVLALLGLLQRGTVTPVTLWDVVEDWLER